MFDQFLSKAGELLSAESPFAVAIVIRHEPPVSGKPGDKAIIRSDGQVWGWIGGGCVQPLVIREALNAMEEGSPRLVRISPSAESDPEIGTVHYPMSCHGGGALEVYIEPVLPKPRILIFGRSPAAQSLASSGKLSATGSASLLPKQVGRIFRMPILLAKNFSPARSKMHLRLTSSSPRRESTMKRRWNTRSVPTPATSPLSRALPRPKRSSVSWRREGYPRKCCVGSKRRPGCKSEPHPRRKLR